MMPPSNFSSTKALPLFCALLIAVSALGAELPPGAKEALDKGVRAVRQQEWKLAIRYLEEARKAAPEFPEIYYNLGLAESKIPGRELRAIAWFGAYLAAVPDAANAAAVKEQIAALDVKSQSDLSLLIVLARDAAVKTGNNFFLGGIAELWARIGDSSAARQTVEGLVDRYKSDALRRIALAQAEVGNLAAARKSTELILDASDRSEAEVAIAHAQIRSGDLEHAQETLAMARTTAAKIEDGFRQAGFLYSEIAEAQVKAGDIAGAQATAALIKNKAYSLRPQANIAKAQVAIGDIEAARATLAAAFKSAAQIERPGTKIEILAALSEAQSASGDSSGSRKTLREAVKMVNLINGDTPVELDDYKGEAWSAISKAQARNGDITAAQRTAARIPRDNLDPRILTIRFPGRNFNEAMAAIAEAQAKAGDISGAQKTANLITDALEKGRAQQLIASARARSSSGKASSLSSRVLIWVDKLDDLNLANDCPLSTAPFLDLAGHLQSPPPARHLPPPRDVERIADHVTNTARTIARARHIISSIMQQQDGK